MIDYNWTTEVHVHVQVRPILESYSHSALSTVVSPLRAEARSVASRVLSPGKATRSKNNNKETSTRKEVHMKRAEAVLYSKTDL